MLNKKNKIKKKVLFVYPAFENLGLAVEYLSASLKKAGHETNLILIHNSEKNYKNRLFQRINGFKPDFIAFSVLTDNYSWSCSLADYIKESFKDIPIIFGGIHITSCPEEVISKKSVDFIILGEGEEAIVELVENPKKTNIKNVWLKKKNKIIKNKPRPLIEDLDKLPFPDKEITFNEAPYFRDSYFIMTSRGCPFSCTYCFNNFMRKFYKGSKWLRRRSVSNVIEELVEMKKKNRYEYVFFGDDCFTFDKTWLKEFFQLYKKEINLPFKAIAHSKFMDEDIAFLLKDAGCMRVELGVQTASERVRKDICKRNDDNATIKKAVEILKKYKILVQIDHMFGLPTEEINDYQKDAEFYIDIKPDFITSFWLQYFPNTDIIDIAKKNKNIDDSHMENVIKGNINIEKVLEGQRQKFGYIETYNFLNWITVLPRPVSRYILRNSIYFKIFKSYRMNIIPNIIKHLSSFELMKVAYSSYKRKKYLKRYYKDLDIKYSSR